MAQHPAFSTETQKPDPFGVPEMTELSHAGKIRIQSSSDSNTLNTIAIY